MFEIPEINHFCFQMNESMRGKTIRAGRLGNSPHKFVWYNRSPEDFARLTAGKTIGTARGLGRWLVLDLDPGYRLVLGECGGKMLLHPAGTKEPEKYHLHLAFEDGWFFTLTTQMWGAMELYESGAETERQYIKGMRPTPAEAAFTFEYFSGLVDECIQQEKRSAKGLLTQDQIIPGLGNSIAQDILFTAGLHPCRSIETLNVDERHNLYRAIVSKVEEVTKLGGRNDELDLFGNPGGYIRIMDSRAAGKPCPVCGMPVEKIQYLGGACYFCPNCQK